MTPLKTKIHEIHAGVISIRELATVCVKLLDRIEHLERMNMTPPVPPPAPSVEQFLELHELVLRLQKELFPSEAANGISGADGVLRPRPPFSSTKKY